VQDEHWSIVTSPIVRDAIGDWHFGQVISSMPRRYSGVDSPRSINAHRDGTAGRSRRCGRHTPRQGILHG
jgi:hypothetical protein